MRTYLYKLTSDRGGAPCAPPPPTGSPPLLSLAICKPALRRTAQPGDRILGLTSRTLEQREGYPALSVIYAASVTSVLDAAEYYAHRSSYRTRPDCIYRYDAATGDLRHTGKTGLHADTRHRRRDLGREGLYENARILLSHEFTYLGPSAFELDQRFHRLRELVSALGQGHRVLTAGKDATIDGELDALFDAITRLPTRFTPRQVHADAYDHPAPNTADRSKASRPLR